MSTALRQLRNNSFLSLVHAENDNSSVYCPILHKGIHCWVWPLAVKAWNLVLLGVMHFIGPFAVSICWNTNHFSFKVKAVPGLKVD